MKVLFSHKGYNSTVFKHMAKNVESVNCMPYPPMEPTTFLLCFLDRKGNHVGEVPLDELVSLEVTQDD